jgi:hypothetical protein
MDDDNCIHDAGVILVRADPGRPRSYKMHKLHQMQVQLLLNY